MIIAVRANPPFLAADRPAEPSPRLYRLADLGAYVDGSPLLPVAINDRNEIGAYTVGGHPDGVMRGFCLSPVSRIPAGLAFGHAPLTCLSQDGQAAGAMGTAQKALRAWAAPLGVFGEELWPGSVSIARGINQRAEIVGDVLFDAGDFMLSRAFVLHAPGKVRCVTPPHGGTTMARGINDAGDVVFNALQLGASPDETHAWCLRAQHYVAIASLGGGYSWANAITSEGRIVGSSLTAAGETHAFLWEDGKTLDLGGMRGAKTDALAANDQRAVVGRVVERQGNLRAIRWTSEAGMTTLDELVDVPAGWTLHEATGINRYGIIVGKGTFRGAPRGFVLHPVDTR